MLKPTYIMIGGFLGAGKTTAVLKLAQLFSSRGQKVGLITNDQSVGLVDTALLDSHGYATEEITGGCFCCRFGSLVEAADRLTTSTQPEVFLAEPVGSCTDLRATVSYPLTRMYGENFTIAPLSVLVDPVRAQRILGLKAGKSFSSKVRYIYEKQLEEADIVVINKTDLLSAGELEELTTAIQSRYSEVAVFPICARTGEGIDAWADAIVNGKLAKRPSMDVDYQVYADGEALLGWLNLQANINSDEEVDGNEWLLSFAQSLCDELKTINAEVAHLKMTLMPEFGNDLAVVNLVRDGMSPEIAYELSDPLDSGELLVNLRAEADPSQLKSLVEELLQRAGEAGKLNVVVTTVEAFRPSPPTPTHRLSESV
ncbi:P-loop NTPase family protein [Lacunimicrobium album]